MASLDFPSGYFQLRLYKESQAITTFITEIGRFCFQRAPQGLNSSGDGFNSNTDRFFSGLGDWLLKQVDDLYIQGTSLSDLSAKMEVVAKEAKGY